MSNHNPQGQNAMLDSFETALWQHFQEEPEPKDDGFSQCVMQALPVCDLQPRVHWVEMLEYAQWIAISFAACGISGFIWINDGRLAVAQAMGVYTLIGLLIFWSVPSRLSRG